MPFACSAKQKMAIVHLTAVNKEMPAENSRGKGKPYDSCKIEKTTRFAICISTTTIFRLH
jgi:hypothetical protein